jgi:hypothetical protein
MAGLILAAAAGTFPSRSGKFEGSDGIQTASCLSFQIVSIIQLNSLMVYVVTLYIRTVIDLLLVGIWLMHKIA